MNPRTDRPGRGALRARVARHHHRVRRLGWIALVASAVLITFPVASATSAALVTGKQIKDGSVTGIDIHNASLSAREFGHLPPGAQGPQCLQGTEGPQGPQGPAGTSGWGTVVGDGVNVGDTESATVTCPSGVAVGGGAGTSVPAFAELKESAPLDVDGSGWVVTVRNIAAPQPLTIFAWAVCVTPREGRQEDLYEWMDANHSSAKVPDGVEARPDRGGGRPWRWSSWH
jgi:hypothetical protein